jgi:hypothetical protein
LIASISFSSFSLAFFSSSNFNCRLFIMDFEVVLIDLLEPLYDQ